MKNGVFSCASGNNNFSYTYTVTAGTLYYIGVRGYSSSHSGSATVYVSGTRVPTSTAKVPQLTYSSTASYTQTVTYGSTVTLPTPYRSGYTFAGWYNGTTLVSSGT